MENQPTTLTPVAMKQIIIDQWLAWLIITRPGCGLHIGPAAPFPVTAERPCVRTAGQLTAIRGPGGRSGISGCVNWEPYGILTEAVSKAERGAKTGGVRERTRVSSPKSKWSSVSRQNDKM